MDLPTYTNIWRIEKRLYKLYDLRLPMPLPIVWIGVFVGVFVPWSLLLVLVGVPVEMPWHVLFLVPPGIVTWLSTRPVIEGKRLTELLESQLRYLGQPKAWYRMAPSSEPETVTFSGRVWRTGPARAKSKAPRKARQPQRRREGQRLTGPRQVRPAVAAAAAAASQAPVAEPPSRTGWGSRRGTAPALKGRVRQGAASPAPGATAGPVWREKGVSGGSGRRPERPVSLLEEAVGAAHAPAGPDHVDMPPAQDELPAIETTGGQAEGGPRRELAAGQEAVAVGGAAGEHDDEATDDARAARRAPEQGPATGRETAVARDAEPLGAHGETSAEAVAAREASVPIKTAESRKPAAGKPIDTEALRRLRRLAASADAPADAPGRAETVARRGSSERGEDEVARDQHRKGQPPRLARTGLELPGTQRVWPPINPNAKPLPRPAVRGAQEGREDTPADLRQDHGDHRTPGPVPAEPAGGDVPGASVVPGTDDVPAVGDVPGTGDVTGSGDAIAADAVGARDGAHGKQQARPQDAAPQDAAPQAPAEVQAVAEDGGVAEGPERPEPVTAGESAAVTGDGSETATGDGDETAACDGSESAAGDGDETAGGGGSTAETGDRGATTADAGVAPVGGEPVDKAAGDRTPATEEPAAVPDDRRASATGEAQHPSNGVAQHPSNGVAQHPSSGAVQHPSSGAAQRPGNGAAQEPREAAGERSGAGGVRGGRSGEIVAPVPVPRPGEGRVRRVESVVGRDSGGWRRIAQVVVGGGGVRTDGSEIDEARARGVFPGGRRIVVLGCTGGAGQTTTALMLGHTFAQVRDDRVVAVDANTGGGTLTSKIQPETPETLTSLLSGLDRVSGYLTMRGYTTRTASGLEVISADTDAGAEQRLADRSFFSDHRLGESMRLLDRHYKLAVIDPAAALAARLLPYADQLVLVVPASEEAPEAVAMTYEWLDGHGCAELRRRAVMVVNGVSRRSMTDVEQAESVARGRCRAIVRVPWEDDLAPGGAETVDPGQLRAAGRRAYLALAGVVVAGFAAQTVRTSEEELASDPPGTRIGER
ncbi:TcpE family conjugal transfer membrane protein [Nonomuraea sp. NPDC050202]|uniref:TcpE family conjugal transfer membrane protein n=1 Tax=Nonomuraea sp. NPDC050202 TaxID=3155035 RepID=UPI003408A75C